ncbi:DUF3592 domain-containing protein [Marivita geojedonensis]|uniref:DUF3592 domain-containing protein n=2 Tax=Marivita geojedonensis TaxID=1123756 RepID=A0A1X4NKM5_9RHOB|nr:DUF3592 domain-containing protein [Marivita geojedonensis]OSQ50763.1 hypothetical protein MGEO_11130 [Marivita geojedonensis]PRY77068.1 uncharacterized protein DUF3592 [Marivita geojedonensis]
MGYAKDKKPLPLWRLFWNMGGYFTLFGAAIVIVTLLIFNEKAKSEQEFALHGEVATAELVRNYTTRKRKTTGTVGSKTVYNFSLRYETVQGMAVSSDRRVERHLFYAYDEGSEFEIKYLPDNPQKTRIGDDDYARSAAEALRIAILLAVITTIISGYVLRQAMAARHARDHGRRETAKVVRVQKTWVRGVKDWQSRLIWMDSSGQEHKSRLYEYDEIKDFEPGQTIAFYRGKKRAWWTGDVGERAED